jgi:exodeoxyribonuclease III
VRIATWNVNSLKARLPRVEEWLAEIGPDVLCLQETKLSDAAFPAMAFQTLGYESVHTGQGQWNGVAILSKIGLEDVTHGFVPDLAQPADEIDEYQAGVLNEARLVTARCGGVLVSSVYVPKTDVALTTRIGRQSWSGCRIFVDTWSASPPHKTRLLCWVTTTLRLMIETYGT